ncbi:MAG: PrsW family intramembrane metalloprotease [Leptospiraceae bacterium]|nr:PrsW family intramembrane metalloprotease [Leptospiraceae bacterium]MCK6382292.1 PrsW family intramembrane metalloprotease [Leptospiraceae bacterium]NUM41193.1 PrsW family intramembrane metalloprotease [Leptospiraceae bacterium]
MWEKINPFVYSVISILPWGLALFMLHPEKWLRKFFLATVSIVFGFLSTQVVLFLHPILWPEVEKKVKKVSLLSQTAHIAFIQAGMMEETFKILFILLIILVFGYNFKKREFHKNSVLISGFVALGFSLIENYTYISKQTVNFRFEIFIGRTIHSSNIHLLINLCFSLFLLKSNNKSWKEKILTIAYGFFLAVFQHGVVDFFLLPSSKFGSWLATALFVGIWVWVVKDMRKFVYETTPVTQ